MAKRQQKRPDPKPRPAPSTAPAVAGPAPVDGDIEPLEPHFTVKQYLLMNIVFDVFCLLLLVLAWYFIREIRGLFFFFGLLMTGFFLVSLFDYFHDRSAARAGEA